MNKFYSFSCRLYQRALYLASFFLHFHEPKLLSGLDCSLELPKLIKKQGQLHPLLITDKGLYDLGLTKKISEAFLKENVSLSIFPGAVPNPTFECVDEAYEVYENDNCDCVIALGGGSSMDAGKALLIRIAYPNRQLSKFKGILKVHRKLRPLYAIPTTAGTGSEATLAAVLVDKTNKDKFQIDDPKLIPSYAILDPSYLTALPRKVIASTGMDALTHAVESYIGRSSTKKSKAYALQATSLIFENLEKFYEEPSNGIYASNMQLASYKAGVSFSRAYVGYVHALAHSLGGFYNVPHGLANAVLLPIVLEAYGKAAYKPLSELAKAAGLKGESKEKLAKAFIEEIRLLNARMGIPNILNVSLEQGDLRKLALHADKEGNPFYPVPKEFNVDELESILKEAFS